LTTSTVGAATETVAVPPDPKVRSIVPGPAGAPTPVAPDDAPGTEASTANAAARIVWMRLRADPADRVLQPSASIAGA
jgi:hypothetical protein